MAALLVAAFAFAGVEDVPIEASVTAGQNLTVAVKSLPGHIESIVLDVASGSTGTVDLVISNRFDSLAPRSLASTNGIIADLWSYPADGASRRYAVTEKDTFLMTVSNSALSAKVYRAVIRIETAK